MAGLGGWLISNRSTRIAIIAALFPLGLLSVISTGLVVLGAELRGWRHAAVDCLIALGILLGIVALTGGQALALGTGAAISWTAAIVLGSLTGLHASLTLPVQVIVVVGVLGVLIFLLWVPDSVAYWKAVLAELSRQLSEMGVEIAEPERLEPLAGVMTGSIAASAVVSAVLALVIGAWLAGRSGGPPFREMFTQIRMGSVIGLFTVVAGLGSLFGVQPASGNVLLVLATGLSVQGLAAIHWHAGLRGIPWPFLALVYVPMFMGPAALLAMLFLLTTLGFIDNWYGLRRSTGDVVK